jgi:serine protease
MRPPPTRSWLYLPRVCTDHHRLSTPLMLGLQAQLRHIIFSLVVCSLGLTPYAFAGSREAVRSSVFGSPKLQRIIIQYKSEASLNTSRSRATVQSTPTDGTARIAALNRRNDLATAPSLSYIKSITPRTHVARTATALSRADLQALVNQIAQDPSVEYAEIDEKAYPHFIPNDNGFPGNQWSLQNTFTGASNFIGAWDQTTIGSAQPIRGTGVVVAVLDTGYRPHADLVNNVLTGYDFVSEDSPGIFTTANDGDGRDADAKDPGDWSTVATADCTITSSWHGTEVSGIVAAQGENSFGMAGAAFGAQILPVRVLGVCGGYVSDIAAGMRWAAGLAVSGAPVNTHPAQVINLSLGGTRDQPCSSTYINAINDVRAVGSVVVASTGNDGDNSRLSQPGKCAGVIAVTAHDATGDRGHNADGYWANIGTGTTLSAPGVAIYTTHNSGVTTPGADTFLSDNGTSFSTPHVSAALALMMQAHPGLTPDRYKNYLTSTARSFPVASTCHANAACGEGMLDANSAVTATLTDTAPFVSATADHSVAVPLGTVVHLTGTATPVAGTSLSSTVWTQIFGPSVTLTTSIGAPLNASFTVPSGAYGTQYVFRLRATSSSSQTADSFVFVNTEAAPVNTGGGGGGGAWDALDAWIGLGLLLAHLGARGLGRRRPTRHGHC